MRRRSTPISSTAAWTCADTLLETHQVASGQLERGLNFNGSYRRPILKTHALALGWELGRTRRDEFRREHQSDAGGLPLLDSDEDYQATVQRTAFWIQDEWDLSTAWSAYLGLRREDLHTTGEGNAHAPVDVDSGVWSPIFQTLFKPGGTDNKDATSSASPSAAPIKRRRSSSSCRAATRSTTTTAPPIRTSRATRTCARNCRWAPTWPGNTMWARTTCSA
jgi:outer membrane receptor protein involved in Fe transport